jgi:hypothetical protein
MKSRKPLLLALVGASLLAGCATGPYYDSYDGTTYYDRRVYSDDYPVYRYYSYGPGYYPPAYYVAPPTVSFGLSYGYRGRWR